VRVVIDTNVLVSGLLSPYSASAEVVRLAVAGALVPLYDARILGEYRELLFAREFEIDRDYGNQLLDAVEANGESVMALPLKKRLPDADDEMFLEVAVSGVAEFIVTFNLRHFPAKACDVPVAEPKVFLETWRKRQPL
jgi:putative PIN family toxin of toxin-antitoxin system